MIKLEDASIVDFETKGIASRPDYPPEPVGCAVQLPGQKREYLAWGHPTGNNTDVGTARRKLVQAYQARATVFHHSAFDLDVGAVHLGLPTPRRVEDTLYLSFLHNPYERDLGLKPLGAKYLDIQPDAQDRLKEWVLANVPEAKKKPSSWGDHMWKAPGTLMGTYAKDDLRITSGIYKKFGRHVRDRNMEEAYERELECTQISMDMERGGVRVDRKRLAKCRDVFLEMEHDVVRRIAKKLRVNPKDLKSDSNKKGFNINSGKQLADALVRAGKLDTITKTKSGKQISTKMAHLEEGCNDKELVRLLGIRSVTQKYMTSFIEPWLDKSQYGGRIQPNFNQVRGYDEGGGGARSGRFSSSDPNLQNVPANPEESQNKDVLMALAKTLQDDYNFKFLGLRDFIIADEGQVMICVDYSQQELRILAHFERGALMRAYLKDPELDIHEYIRQLILRETGLDFPRKHIKITVFGIIYGMGIGKLADRLEVDNQTAKSIKNSLFKVVPGIPKLMRQLEDLANHDEPLKTWGGREYYCEEPKYNRDHGRWQSFEYKMLNYKIQPSAADCTKAGMINVRRDVPQVRIAIQVHDELVCMAPHKKYGPRIAAAMCDVKFRVPMLAEPKYSTTSWARAAA
jgi:DNA polymerase I-like protein with 3'-5' exonuclease and polymerase domains